MVVCKYKTSVLKDNKPFEHVDSDKEFKTTSELEARRVIQKWNNRGCFASEVNIKWRYDYISLRPATVGEFDSMRLYKSSNC